MNKDINPTCKMSTVYYDDLGRFKGCVTQSGHIYVEIHGSNKPAPAASNNHMAVQFLQSHSEYIAIQRNASELRSAAIRDVLNYPLPVMPAELLLPPTPIAYNAHLVRQAQLRVEGLKGQHESLASSMPSNIQEPKLSSVDFHINQIRQRLVDGGSSDETINKRHVDALTAQLQEPLDLSLLSDSLKSRMDTIRKLLIKDEEPKLSTRSNEDLSRNDISKIQEEQYNTKTLTKALKKYTKKFISRLAANGIDVDTNFIVAHILKHPALQGSPKKVIATVEKLMYTLNFMVGAAPAHAEPMLGNNTLTYNAQYEELTRIQGLSSESIGFDFKEAFQQVIKRQGVTSKVEENRLNYPILYALHKGNAQARFIIDEHLYRPLRKTKDKLIIASKPLGFVGPIVRFGLDFIPERDYELGMMLAYIPLGVGAEKAIAKTASPMLSAWKKYRADKWHNLARDRIQHESLKSIYRQKMAKPYANDLKLSRIVNRLYRPRAQIGCGSTADAIRYEISTGNSVKGKHHIDKGKEFIRALEDWIKSNPHASSGDRAIAENILMDIKDALGEKPWFSKTNVPK